MSRTGKWFWTLVAAQLVFLLAWAGYHEVVRQCAPVLLLKARPVDPRDLLRGDYMTVSYDISQITLPAPTDKTGFGPDVWVLLERKVRYWVVAQTSRDQLEPKPGQVLVRGDADDWNPPARQVWVKYGIEKYFVPEGKGTPRFKLMEVEVTVSPAHRLNLKRVLLDGKAFP